MSGRAPRLPWWPPAIAGASVAIALLGVWFMFASVRIGPFPPFDLANLVVRESPGALATWAIETFQSRARPSVVAGSILAVVAVWSIGAIALRRWPARRAALIFALAQAPLVIALAMSADSRDLPGFVWLALLVVLTLSGAGLLLGRWLEALADDERLRADYSERSPEWSDQFGSLSRRDLLTRVAVVGVGAGLGTTVAGTMLRLAGVNEPATLESTPLAEVRERAATAGLPNVVTPGPTAPAAPVADTLDLPIDVRPRITSNRDFYVIDISLPKPIVPETTWSLRVRGLVERELTLTYADLLNEPAVDVYGTLMCISYTHANDLISSTLWTGVPLARVLERAGVRDGVVDVVCRGSGGYSDSLPIDVALDPRTLLAYGMNGVALPRSHGFPCRLYVPGIYGEKNVKWLYELELADTDYQGYWQERGWTDVAIVNTQSAFDIPDGVAEGNSANGLIAGGFAFAGTRGVSAVEVRVDDGPWQLAEIEPNDPPLLLQRWRFQSPVPPGRHVLTVRCVDGVGVVQTESEREPHPDGMTGLHSIEVDVI